MKFIFCPNCNHFLQLEVNNLTTCNCGESMGMYQGDGINTVYWGSAIPIGVNNHSFVQVLTRQPKQGQGKKFEAFVISKNCPTFKRGL